MLWVSRIADSQGFKRIRVVIASKRILAWSLSDAKAKARIGRKANANAQVTIAAISVVLLWPRGRSR